MFFAPFTRMWGVTRHPWRLTQIAVLAGLRGGGARCLREHFPPRRDVERVRLPHEIGLRLR